MKLSGQIRRYLGWFLAIIGLIVIALPVAFYITHDERLRFPWEKRYHISARFSSAQAVAPGQGQNVEVAGVTVGEITDVELDNGVAKVGMDIRPDKLKHVYTNAHMLLRPKTGLNDMEVELDPGRPPAPPMHSGDTLPLANTQPNVNP